MQKLSKANLGLDNPLYRPSGACDAREGEVIRSHIVRLLTLIDPTWTNLDLA